MHIHIVGICGTFMGGLAQIAKSLGHRVSGCDENVYPPMSDQLIQSGVDLLSGYKAAHLSDRPDIVIIGNTISRGNPVLERILEEQIPFYSGPEWLYREVLYKKHVLAVSGTHGKTTTTTILSWLLEFAGKNPGFLIGGVAENFGQSARYTDADYFVIEADEYDTAFSDKRSKFVHYHPKTLVINNIEFDHADIFHDLADIRRQFHHLIRILPKSAEVIYPAGDKEVEQVLAMGCWSNTVSFANEHVQAEWNIAALEADFQRFKVLQKGREVGQVNWSLIGEHNAQNALTAMIAANHIGIPVEQACAALSVFKSVKRRLECIFDDKGIRIYDDFAHHPTAIAKTLQAMRLHAGSARIIAVMEPRSNTMKMEVHANTLAASLQEADQIFIYKAETIDWDIEKNMSELGSRCAVLDNVNAIVEKVVGLARAGDYIVIMSNGGFSGIHQTIIEALK